MSRRKKNNGRNGGKKNGGEKKEAVRLHPTIKKNIWVVVLLGAAILLVLAAAGEAGPAGRGFFSISHNLLGLGYYLLPAVALLFAASFITPEERSFFGATLIGGALFVLSGLGFLDIVSPGRGGLAGSLIGALETSFGAPASLVVLGSFLIVSFLVVLNRPFDFSRVFRKREKEKSSGKELMIKMPETAGAGAKDLAESGEKAKSGEKIGKNKDESEFSMTMVGSAGKAGAKAPLEVKNYVAPPLSLLSSQVEKPTIGDLRANAGVIRRTLESFGIPVEMGEINVGPSVTRYTLKPAEGVKISRITALGQDLALALAAHPIRIEAPIPGRSLVGIEAPNKTAATVRLGSLLLYPEFQAAHPLSFGLGRNVNGDPIFPDISGMPHLLIAGATGSGKSITLHSLLISLLYKNSPEMMRLILIDPKRVELSVYNGIPHLLSPVITDNKKAIGALRWVIQEMERRYQVLMEAGARDIKSYNKKETKEPLSYIVLVIDELADLMASYGREVEGSIIRLAQMARATGIHLLVSTQRPSVEVITGLIKANITSRIALQVASQIDSRTILDGAGAEKLLGKGDLLFMNSEFSKPRRIQGSFVSEEEIKNVVSFIKKHNAALADGTPEEAKEIMTLAEKAREGGETESGGRIGGNPDFSEWSADKDDDDLYEEAVAAVRTAQKASASLLQRRLRIGYARAARLLDMMEERGVVGPGDGAKPREVLL